MQFDWTIHLADIPVLLGGILFMFKMGAAMQKIDSTFQMMWKAIDDHSKRLEERREDSIRIHDRIDALGDRRQQHARG